MALHDHPKLGAGLAIASATLFALSTPLAKALLGDVSPWLLAGLLYLGSGVGLFVLHALQRTRSETPLRLVDLPWLGGAVISGGVIGPVLLMVGLSTTTASSAALMLNLEGLATMLIAWLAFREATDKRIVFGALAILAGAIVLSWQSGALGFGAGTLAIAGACLAWGIDNNLTRKIANADPVQIAMIKGLVAGAINLTLALVMGAHLPSVPMIAAAGVVGFLGYGVSLVLFVLALRHIGSARTGAYFSTAPFVGAAVGIALFSEAITLQLIVAAALMAFGVWLHLTEEHDHQHTHEALEHEHAHSHDAHHQHEHGPNDPAGEPHAHWHRHGPMTHRHPHFPDLHHGHSH